MDACGGWRHPGDVESPLRPRARSCVVLRPVGAVRRTARCRISHRCGGHAVTPLDPHLLVRGGAVYIATLAMLAAWVWRRPTRRLVAGALLAAAWNVPVIIGLYLFALRWGWWSFNAHGGLFLGMPVDLYVAWVCLWGVVPALAFPASPVLLVGVFPFIVDLLLM